MAGRQAIAVFMFQGQNSQSMHHDTESTTIADEDIKSATVEDLPRRVRDIATLRGLGYSFREIGRELKVSPQAVSLMLSRHRRSLASLDQAVELLNLSSRAVNALARLGVHTRREAVRTNLLERLLHERNCGSKTRAEIQRWMEEESQTFQPVA